MADASGNFSAIIIGNISNSNGSNDSNTTCNDAAYYHHDQYISQGVCIMLMICFGVPANIVNMLVFMHPSMRKQSIINWYLAALSSCDLVALLCGLCMFSIPVIGEWTRNFEVSNVVTKAVVFMYPIGLIAQTASVYSTICVSAHRFIVVWMPFRAHRFCSKRVAKATICSVVFLSILYNIPRWMELRLETCYSPKLAIHVHSILSSEMRTNTQYFRGYYTFTYGFVMLIIPFALLIVMNSLVVFTVHRSRKRHLTSDIIARQEAAKERKTTMMLLGVVVIFLFCNVLALYNNFYEMQKSDEDRAKEETFTGRLLIDLSNILVVANASVNIFVYLCFSDKYRLVVWHFVQMPFSSKQPEDALTLEKLLTNAGGS